MYYIRNVKKTNIDAVRNYLLDVPTIKKVDEEILKKAVFISKKDEIYGVVSYEIIENYALIRCFVYKRNIDMDLLKELFSLLEEKIIKNNIYYILSLVENEQLFSLFSSLGFAEYVVDDFRDHVVKSKNKNCKRMLKEIFLEKKILS